jgi:hypothetical protein
METTATVFELPVATYEGRLYNDGFDPAWRAQIMPYKAVVCLEKDYVEALKEHGLEKGAYLMMGVYDHELDMHVDVKAWFDKPITFDDVLKFADVNLQKYEDYHVYLEGINCTVNEAGEKTYFLNMGS